MSQYSSNASKRSRPLEPSNAPTQGTAQAITLANQATPGSGVSSAPSSTTPTVPSEVSLAHPSTTWTANTEQSQPIANGLTPTPAEGGQTPTAAAVQANGEDTHGKRRKIIITKVIKNSNSQAGAGGSQDSSRGSVEKDIVDSIMNGAVGGMNIGGGETYLCPRPLTRLNDIAGLEPILQQVKELVFYPVLFPNLYQFLGVVPPCGLILHGPSGCGKTLLAHAIAGELDLPFFKASGPELVGGTSGESEERIRGVFQAALDKAPSILFIDAIDVIAGKKDMTQRGMDRRILAQLSDSIDLLSNMGDHASRSASSDTPNPSSSSTSSSLPHSSSSSSSSSTTTTTSSATSSSSTSSSSSKPKMVILIAATNKADNLDPSLRGRFARELVIPVPDAPARTKILTLLTSSMRLCDDVDLKALGHQTPGKYIYYI